MIWKHYDWIGQQDRIDNEKQLLDTKYRYFKVWSKLKLVVPLLLSLRLQAQSVPAPIADIYM